MVELPAAAGAARSRSRWSSRSPGRTSTCSSSTSPRASSSIRPAATTAARSSTGCSRSTRPAATTTSGPASSTGSTATRRACSSSRARRRRTRRLQELIRRRELERRYLALVRGAPQSRTGRIEAAIGRDRVDRSRHSLDTATPREAVTHFETLELLPAHALLEVRLETGRTHQIRVHLEAIELPVAGDPVYGVAGDLGPRAPVPARGAPGVPASADGRAGRRRVAAAGRPGRALERARTARLADLAGDVRNGHVQGLSPDVSRRGMSQVQKKRDKLSTGQGRYTGQRPSSRSGDQDGRGCRALSPVPPAPRRL